MTNALQGYWTCVWGWVKDSEEMSEVHRGDRQKPRLAKQKELEWESMWRVKTGNSESPQTDQVQQLKG